MGFLQIPPVCALRTCPQRVVLNRIRLLGDLGAVSVWLPLMFGPPPVCWFALPPPGASEQENEVFVRKVPNGPRRGMR